MVLTIFFLDSGIGTKKTLIFLFLFSPRAVRQLHHDEEGLQKYLRRADLHPSQEPVSEPGRDAAARDG